MKRSPADAAFSDCIRAAHNHTCEKCGKEGRMEASHVYGRRHRTIRWDVLNCNCLCHYCHRMWHENPLDSAIWFDGKFGDARREIIREKRDSMVKVSKLEEKDIAKHYKKQYKLIQEARDKGEAGYIEFESWQ